MADIFISYARSDNVNNSVQNFLELLLTRYKTQFGKVLTPFIDFKNLEIGDNWNSEIENAAITSDLMLAFLSPSYLQSTYCGKEWRCFYNKNEEDEDKSILPIEIVPLEDNEHGYSVIEDLINEQIETYDQALKLQIGKFSDFENNEAEKEKFIKNLCYSIRNKLKKKKPDKPIKNIHIINEKIDKLEDDRYNEIYEKILAEERSFRELKPVCVIYTGGTVGMVREENKNKDSVLKIGNVEDLKDHIYKLKELEFDVDFYSYEKPLDSSNIVSKDWVKLAMIIKALYVHYQGFVILHGANTMAHTASALSFMFKNLSKPVILTGAEIPLIQLNSDAEQNVMRAIQAAAPESKRSKGNIPEVCIVFGNSVIRGNRATKKHSLNINEGFYSPNYPVLGTIDNNEISLNHREIRKVDYNKINRDKLELNPDMAKSGIFVFEVYPDMELEYYLSVFENKNLRGVIIKTYGTGNIPDMPPDFLNVLERLIKRDVIIVNITQCPHGYVELRLFETNARLFDIGVINGGDMTLEAAYCKLKHLLGKYPNGDISSVKAIKEEMQIDKAGELTFSSYTITYGKNGDKTIAAPIFKGTPKNIGHLKFDPSDIDHAYLRIQGINILTEGLDKFHVKIYVNRNSVTLKELAEDENYKIGSFIRSFKKGEIISHNIEVTDKIRQLIKYEAINFTIQVVSADNQHFDFESLELTIFTRNK